jgi:flagellar motility protein MotE (MotC chaperone)
MPKAGYGDHFKKVKAATRSQPVYRPIVEKKKREAKGTSSGFIVALGLGTVVAAFAYFNFQELDEFFGKIEVGVFGSAQAKEEKTAPGPEGKKENSAASTEPQKENACPDLQSTLKEEMSHFGKLSERKKQLDLRESELNALEEELHKQKKEVEERIAKLESIRGEIGKVLKDRIAVDEERVGKLVEFYSNMKPKQAAEVFNSLNDSLAVEVLGKMKKKNAAEIMNLLEPKKAQALTEKFAGYQKR